MTKITVEIDEIIENEIKSNYDFLADICYQINQHTVFHKYLMLFDINRNFILYRTFENAKERELLVKTKHKHAMLQYLCGILNVEKCYEKLRRKV